MALEINCQAHRLDLSDANANAARRAWLTKDNVLNTRSVEDFRAALRRHRTRN